jgi:uncharacterized protein (DUF1684 family)
MKTTVVKATLLGILLVTGAGANGDEKPDMAAYEAEIVAWRAERLANLKAPFGFLNLVGLYWLEEGTTRIGSAADNDIVFPKIAAQYLAELRVSQDGVVLVANPGADIRQQGDPVQSVYMADDTMENPVALSHGSLAWTIIRRDDRFALRLRDFEHPAIRNFAALDYYPIDAAYRVSATLQPFDEPKILNVNTTIAGLGYRPESPGTLSFELNGQLHELEAYKSGDRLFIVFGDQTSGRETYPAGRFVYTAWPGDDGTTILDFNKAYNPPCAFNAFATCPVASPRNRLRTRVEVGETFDPETHSVPEGYN